MELRRDKPHRRPYLVDQQCAEVPARLSRLAISLWSARNAGRNSHSCQDAGVSVLRAPSGRGRERELKRDEDKAKEENAVAALFWPGLAGCEFRKSRFAHERRNSRFFPTH